MVAPMRSRPVVIALFLCLLPFSVRADRGSVPYKKGVQVFEPVQRAMIAWNGEEEILLLSTDLRVSERTKVLEVLPLPSEPEVSEGDVEVFRRATALINEKLAKMQRGARDEAAGGDQEHVAGEVAFHETIGAHDISVARVLDPDGFVDWIDEYLSAAGVSNPTVPPILRESVEEYMKDGFTWFVFDVVDLDVATRTNDAVQYRFRTESLFYPIKISRTNRGETSIEMLVLTPRMLRLFPELPIERVELRHRPISITSAELASLSGEMDELLGHRSDMKLRIWRIRGDIRMLDRDLVAR